MLRRIRKFLALDWQHKKLFLQAYLVLGKVRFSLLRRPFKKLVAELNVSRDAVVQTPLESSARAAALAVGWAVRTAANFTPWESTCLVQVLAAQRLLQKRGIAGVFYLGATNTGAGDEAPGFLAHAWLKCNGEFITGESGHRNYTVISSFSWP
jgi:hypothetical protein